MMQHVLESRMFLPLEREQVFAFFADAGNLARITPPELGFRMVMAQPVTMRVGLEIDYRIRVLGVPLKWRSLISRWDPPREFVDEQLRGPYRQWIHTHRFSQHEDPQCGAGTLIEDEVRYQLPLGRLGDLFHPLVRRQLEHIFQYRQQTIERVLLSEA
jgi:ligand-binding SRPBCC domain-containing protein